MPTVRNPKLLFILVLGLFILPGCKNCFGQIRISFEVFTPTALEDNEILYITGNQSSIGLWDPGKVKLMRTDSTHWEGKFLFYPGDILEYKFTKGTWETEAADSSGKPFQNFVDRVTNDTTLFYEILNWKNGKDAEVPGQITGVVEYHRNMKGNGIRDRDLIVWLPPGYKENSSRRYPALYMHDGQNIIDPNTAAFKVDWQMDETADSLIRSNIIDPVIIVGIYNTPDRPQEYSPGKKGQDYMRFLAEIVKPMIDLTYRTLPDRENTIVGGSSMGGLISLMLVWEYPEIFSGAICMSPAFKIRSFDYVDDVLKFNGETKQVKLFIYNGGIGIEEEIQPGIDEMLKALDSKGYVRGQDYFWFKDKEARHFEADWGNYVDEALEIFFKTQ